jgi:tripartite-type tricarboxylate transporter receptor subunit TctC
MRHLTKFLVSLAMAVPLCALAADGHIVKVIVPYAPGGNIDSLARLYAQQASKILNETWIIENIAGANGTIGTRQVALAKPDGNTLLFSADVHSMAPLVMKNVPYDPIKDFTPIALVATAPLVLVANPEKVKANNLTELIQAIKAAPADFTFANSGLGSSPQMGAEVFQVKSGTKVLQVSYKGTGPAIIDVLGGHASMMFVTPVAAMQLVRNGKLKALAMTSPKRFESAQEVPTTAEAGMPDFVILNSYGFWGPKGMSKETLERLSNAFKQASQLPELSERLLKVGASATWESPGEFAKHIQTEFLNNQATLKRAGVKPE